MEDLKTVNTRLQGQLLHAQDLVTAQRQVITALGELVTEMMQTLSHYEQQLGAAPPLLAARKQPRKQQNRQSKRKA
jgi:hypothetical protein